MLSFEEIDKLFDEDYYAKKLLGAKIIEAKDDYAKCMFEITKNHKNAKNVVMGGAIFSLADFTFAVAANQHEEYYTVSTTSNISFLNPGLGKSLIAEATKIKDGKMVCFYEVNIFNERNRLIAKANFTGTHVVKENQK